MPTTLPLTCQTCGAQLDIARSDGVCAICLFGEALEQELNETFGGHELCGEIARGGMGVVYRAMQREPRREVALKTLRGTGMDSPEAQARFRDEARTMAELEHLGILPIYQFGQQDGVLFFTMKLAAGGTLAERTTGFAGQWEKIAAMISNVADAVQFAHEHGVLHRDIKPGNILFDEDDRVFVSDFGLAKLAESAEGGLTVSAAMLGTPHYMAPEIAAHGLRSATITTDVWSLGVVLYELLAQKRPFKSESMPALLREIAEREPDALSSSVPSDLRIIASKALAKDPARRYASARALADDLRCWLEGRPITARPTPGAERAWLWMKRNPALAALACVLVLVVTAGTCVMLSINRKLASAVGTAETNLRAALLSSARLLSGTGLEGQRHAAIKAVSRSLRYGVDDEARSEAAAALAKVDLHLRATTMFDKAYNPNQLSEFSSDLLLCAHQARRGGWVLADSRTGKAVRRFPAGRVALRFAFNDENSLVAVIYQGGLAEVWQVEGGDKPLASMQASPLMGGRPFAFLPSGGWIYQRPDGSLWKQENEKTLATQFTPPMPNRGAGSLAIHRATDRIAVLSSGALDVWDLKSGLNRFHQQLASSLTGLLEWHPSGTAIYSTEASATSRQIVLLRLDKPAPPTVMAGNRDFISRIAVDPNGRLLASMSHDGNLRLFDARSGLLLLSRTGYEDQVCFSRDGHVLAASSEGGLVGFFDLAAESVWHNYTSPVGPPFFAGYGMASSKDERFLVAAGNDSMRVWNLESRELISGINIPVKSRSSNVLIDPRSGDVLYRPERTLCRRSVSWDSSLNMSNPHFGEPEPVDVPGGATPVQLINHEHSWLMQKGLQWQLWPEGDSNRSVLIANKEAQAFSTATVSDDGRFFAGINSMPVSRLSLFKLGHSQQAATTVEIKDVVRLSFSPDGRWLLASCLDQFVLFTTLDGSLERKLTVPFSTRHPAWSSYSGDSRLLALQDENDAIRILSLPNLELGFILRPPYPIRISAMVFNQAGTRLFIHGVGERVFEWDLAGLQTEMKKLGMEWRR